MPRLRERKSGGYYIVGTIHGDDHIYTWQVTKRGADIPHQKSVRVDDDFPQALLLQLIRSGDAFTLNPKSVVNGTSVQPANTVVPPADPRLANCQGKSCVPSRRGARAHSGNRAPLHIIRPPKPPELILVWASGKWHLRIPLPTILPLRPVARQGIPSDYTVSINGDQTVMPPEYLAGKPAAFRVSPSELYHVEISGEWPSWCGQSGGQYEVDGIGHMGVLFAIDGGTSRRTEATEIRSDSSYVLIIPSYRFRPWRNHLPSSIQHAMTSTLLESTDGWDWHDVVVRARGCPASSAEVPFIPPEHRGHDPLGSGSADGPAELTALLDHLQSSEPGIRASAAERLGQIGMGREALCVAAGDPDAHVRAAAVRALACSASGHETSVADQLLRATNDPDHSVRVAAVRSIGLLRIASAREHLTTMLRNRTRRPSACSDEETVSACILALAGLGCKDLAQELCRYISMPSRLVRRSVTRAVALLDYRPAGTMILGLLTDALTRPRRDLKLLNEYVRALGSVEERSAVPLLKEVAVTSRGLRTSAIKALAAMGVRSLNSEILCLLADGRAELRLEVALLVIQADYMPALPKIRELLRDPSPRIRQVALEGVMKWRDPGSIAEVCRMSEHDSILAIRHKAADVLAYLIEPSRHG